MFLGADGTQPQILGRLHEIDDPAKPSEIGEQVTLRTTGCRGIRHAVEPLDPETQHGRDRPARLLEEDHRIGRDRSEELLDRIPIV